MKLKQCGGAVLQVIVFIRIALVSLYGASKTGNPLTMRGDNPPNPFGPKCARYV
jgi:hypothetical protein